MGNRKDLEGQLTRPFNNLSEMVEFKVGRQPGSDYFYSRYAAKSEPSCPSSSSAPKQPSKKAPQRPKAGPKTTGAAAGAAKPAPQKTTDHEKSEFASKNYYEILGIDKDAAAADIKTAYRKAAREWHPDRFSAESDLKQ